MDRKRRGILARANHRIDDSPRNRVVSRKGTTPNRTAWRQTIGAPRGVGQLVDHPKTPREIHKRAGVGRNHLPTFEHHRIARVARSDDQIIVSPFAGRRPFLSYRSIYSRQTPVKPIDPRRIDLRRRAVVPPNVKTHHVRCDDLFLGVLNCISAVSSRNQISTAKGRWKKTAIVVGIHSRHDQVGHGQIVAVGVRFVGQRQDR